MAKRKRKQSNQNRQRRKAKPIIINMEMDDFPLIVAEEHTRRIMEEIPKRYLETEFGKICIHPDSQILNLPKSVVGAMLVENIGEKEEMDEVENLLYYEKMAEKFPDEPFFAQERAQAYMLLEKEEKAEKIAAENYESFKGYTSIDVLHGRLTLINKGVNMRKELFGDNINPHAVYPDRVSFTEDELINYFSLQAYLYANEKDYDTARKIASLISKVSENKDAELFENNVLFTIDLNQYPGKARLKKITFWIILLSVLGGIVVLIRWVIGLF